MQIYKIIPLINKKEPLDFTPTTLPHEKHEHKNYNKVTNNCAIDCI
jgi:hypothetical protein